MVSICLTLTILIPMCIKASKYNGDMKISAPVFPFVITGIIDLLIIASIFN